MSDGWIQQSSSVSVAVAVAVTVAVSVSVIVMVTVAVAVIVVAIVCWCCRSLPPLCAVGPCPTRGDSCGMGGFVCGGVACTQLRLLEIADSRTTGQSQDQDQDQDQDQAHRLSGTYACTAVAGCVGACHGVPGCAGVCWMTSSRRTAKHCAPGSVTVCPAPPPMCSRPRCAPLSFLTPPSQPRHMLKHQFLPYPGPNSRRRSDVEG